MDTKPVVHGFFLAGGSYVEQAELPVPWGNLTLDLAALLAD